jgi:hypothetical protein
MRFEDAAWLLDRLVSDDNFVDFLTEPAYEFVAGVTTVPETMVV